MSTRRPTISSQSSSYAAVLAGQARQQSSQQSAASENGFDRRNSSNYPTHSSGGLLPDGQQRVATVPSYLAESAFAERLALRMSTAFNPPPTGALGSSSSTSSGKKPHRGLASEVTEHAQGGGDDLANYYLPSRWNEADRSQSIELLGNGMEARFTGQLSVELFARAVLMPSRSCKGERERRRRRSRGPTNASAVRFVLLRGDDRLGRKRRVRYSSYQRKISLGYMLRPRAG